MTKIMMICEILLTSDTKTVKVLMIREELMPQSAMLFPPLKSQTAQRHSSFM